jgi:hypothetical protein
MLRKTNVSMRLGERVARLKTERTIKDVWKKAHSRSELPFTST